MEHAFPDKPTTHKVSFTEGSSIGFLVGPSETFGHALARMGFSAESVESVTLPDAPLHYEPDFVSATR